MAKAKTWDEWKAEGRAIRKGEKAQRDSIGRCVFTAAQTTEATVFQAKPGPACYDGSIEHDNDNWEWEY